MTKFSGIATNSAPTLTDYLLGVTSGNVDFRATIQAIGQLIVGAAWTSFTPSFTALTVGNGTLNGRYIQVGKTVHVRVDFTLGSTSTVGTGPTMTLPVTSVSMAPTLAIWIGHAYLQGVLGVVRWLSTTSLDFTVINTAGTYGVQNGVTATIPITWTTGNVISLYFSYEAA